MPDIFIPRDTSGITSYFSNIINTGILYQFALEYSDKNHDKLDKFGNYKELYEYLKQQPLVYELADFAASKGIKKRPTLMEISRNLIETQLHAYIIRNFFDNEGFYPVFLHDDATLNKAIDVIKKGLWKPEVYSQYNDTEKKSLSSAYISGGIMSKPLYAYT
ncbi:MAG: peptidase S41, partial [Tannerella sp.]|jgi:carboxyl-terminal processing protease|nr:peptidase S41 [Tannerella sp.]